MKRGDMKSSSTCFWIVVILFVALFHTKLTAKPNDMYLIFYITRTGHTGHVGIAVDNYRIVVRDTVISKNRTVVYDTLKNYSLTYYDLWGPPTIGLDEHNKNLPGRYYKLPRSSAEERITVDYFLRKGLPHSYRYPCDALLKIKTDASADFELKEIAEAIQQERKYFNTRSYNCTDYIIQCLNRLLGVEIKAQEYIPFSWSSTPNKFYRVVVSDLDVDIIKDAGPEVNESFFKERVIHTVLFNQFMNHEKTN
jgi:hypothetical protein